MRKIFTVVGARPQFIKASVVSKAILENSLLKEVLLHTGQHFDQNMSEIFFDQLSIPRPSYQLEINGGTHGIMTGRMLMQIEEILLVEKPDIVLVYGDTNSTLAGALAGAKLQIPIAHVEAGLRSFNKRMPEEINRILTDQVSDILFCPTDAAVRNLTQEGFRTGKGEILQVGDVMQDAAILFSKIKKISKTEGSGDFILSTLHRAENTDDPVRLASIVQALNEIHRNIAPVVMPLHPRTQFAIKNAGLVLQVEQIEPVGYLEMIGLLQRCDLVLTDSGGLQKEAFFFGKSCVTLRDETEWVELIEAGANELAGADTQKIIKSAAENFKRSVVDVKNLYGGGQAAQRVASRLSA